MSFKTWSMDDVKRHNDKVNNQLKADKKIADNAGISPAQVRMRREAGVPVKRKPAYTEAQVIEWCIKHNLPQPCFEHRFHPVRKWRFDIAWFYEVIAPSPRSVKVALEIQGGLWTFGGHSRAMGMKRDWEKWIAAQVCGWKMAWCEPKDLLTESTANIIKELLK